MDNLDLLSHLFDNAAETQWESPVQSLTWLSNGMKYLGITGEALIVKMPYQQEHWYFDLVSKSISPCEGILVNKLEIGLLKDQFFHLKIEDYDIYYPCHDPIHDSSVRLLIQFAIAQFLKAQAIKQLVNSKRTFELTFEQVSSGRCVTDLEGWIQEVNQKFCDMIGYPMEETLKLRIKDLTYPEDWDIDWDYKLRLFSGEIPYFSMQKRYIKKDGTLTWVYTTVTQIKGHGDQPDYLIGIVQDINDQKAAENLLKHQNEILESEVKKRTAELTEANAIKDQTIQQLENLQALLVKNATIDPLTGLYNRRYMLEQIAHEFSRFQRNQRPFSLILTDIDFFKSINDSHGHDCGDEILQQVSNLLKALLGTKAVVCRWGGEEFLILLPDSDENQSFAIAERIRVAVEDHSFTYNTDLFQLSMTLGVATMTQNLSPKDLIKVADTALYKGKAAGRNCVQCFQQEFR